MKSITLSLSMLLTVLIGCDPLTTPATVETEAVHTVQALTSGQAPNEGNLRAALWWNIFDSTIASCLDGIEIPERSLDPSNVNDLEIFREMQVCYFYSTRGRLEADGVEVDAELGSFSIPVEFLPNDDVLSIHEDARLGIAHIIIYADDDGNETFELTPVGADAFVDRIVGASQASNDVNQTLLVFREGNVHPMWRFYSALGCGEPPLGFSTVDIRVTDSGYDCTFSSEPIVVAFDSAFSSLGCENVVNTPAVTEAPLDNPISGEARARCDFETLDLVVTQGGSSVCPDVARYNLVGCTDLSSSELCEETSWEQQAPMWWPCEEFTTGFDESYIDQDATAGLDVVARFSYYGNEGFEVREISITVQLLNNPPLDFDADISIEDLDGDGRLGFGEDVVVRESSNVFDSTSNPGPYLVTISAGNQVGQGVYIPGETGPTREPIALTFEVLGPVVDGEQDLLLIHHADTSGDYDAPFLGHVGFMGGGPSVNASAALRDDVNGDGRFGPGDTIVLRDAYEDITPAYLASFGNTVWVELLYQENSGVGAPVGYGETILN